MLVERVSVSGGKAVISGRPVDSDLAAEAQKAWAILEAARKSFNMQFPVGVSSPDPSDSALASMCFDAYLKPKADVYLALVGSEMQVSVPVSRLNGTAPGTLYHF